MEPNSGDLDTGAVIGIAVGSACCGLISALVLVAIVRARGKSNDNDNSDKKSDDAGVQLKSQYGSFPSDSREVLPLQSNYANPNPAAQEGNYDAGRVLT
jgi:hypothetical protein